MGLNFEDNYIDKIRFEIMLENLLELDYEIDINVGTNNIVMISSY